MNTVVPRNNRMQHPSGFTLVELLIAMVISALVLTAFYRVFDNLQSSSIQQVEIATMQQNQRGALAIMEREFRMIAADRGLTGQFRVTDIRRYTVTEPGTTATPDNSAAGSPILRFTADLDNDGLLGANETITYLLYDRDGDPANGFDLARSVFNAGNGLVSQRDLLAESVDAIGFAYAFDQNLDGRIDRAGANDDIIWGVDTDNDGAPGRRYGQHRVRVHRAAQHDSLGAPMDSGARPAGRQRLYQRRNLHIGQSHFTTIQRQHAALDDQPDHQLPQPMNSKHRIRTRESVNDPHNCSGNQKIGQ
jgi:prepilin-type N-terminal cleavage/methylation domain-containing protein